MAYCGFRDLQTGGDEQTCRSKRQWRMYGRHAINVPPDDRPPLPAAPAHGAPYCGGQAGRNSGTYEQCAGKSQLRRWGYYTRATVCGTHPTGDAVERQVRAREPRGRGAAAARGRAAPAQAPARGRGAPPARAPARGRGAPAPGRGADPARGAAEALVGLAGGAGRGRGGAAAGGAGVARAEGRGRGRGREAFDEDDYDDDEIQKGYEDIREAYEELKRRINDFYDMRIREEPKKRIADMHGRLKRNVERYNEAFRKFQEHTMTPIEILRTDYGIAPSPVPILDPSDTVQMQRLPWRLQALIKVQRQELKARKAWAIVNAGNRNPRVLIDAKDAGVIAEDMRKEYNRKYGIGSAPAPIPQRDPTPPPARPPTPPPPLAPPHSAVSGGTRSHGAAVSDGGWDGGGGAPDRSPAANTGVSSSGGAVGGLDDDEGRDEVRSAPVATSDGALSVEEAAGRLEEAQALEADAKRAVDEERGRGGDAGFATWRWQKAVARRERAKKTYDVVVQRARNTRTPRVSQPVAPAPARVSTPPPARPPTPPHSAVSGGTRSHGAAVSDGGWDGGGGVSDRSPAASTPSRIPSGGGGDGDEVRSSPARAGDGDVSVEDAAARVEEAEAMVVRTRRIIDETRRDEGDVTFAKWRWKNATETLEKAKKVHAEAIRRSTTAHRSPSNSDVSQRTRSHDPVGSNGGGASAGRSPSAGTPSSPATFDRVEYAENRLAEERANVDRWREVLADDVNNASASRSLADASGRVRRWEVELRRARNEQNARDPAAVEQAEERARTARGGAGREENDAALAGMPRTPIARAGSRAAASDQIPSRYGGAKDPRQTRSYDGDGIERSDVSVGGGSRDGANRPFDRISKGSLSPPTSSSATLSRSATSSSAASGSSASSGSTSSATSGTLSRGGVVTRSGGWASPASPAGSGAPSVGGRAPSPGTGDARGAEDEAAAVLAAMSRSPIARPAASGTGGGGGRAGPYDDVGDREEGGGDSTADSFPARRSPAVPPPSPELSGLSKTQMDHLKRMIQAQGAMVDALESAKGNASFKGGARDAIKKVQELNELFPSHHLDVDTRRANGDAGVESVVASRDLVMACMRLFHAIGGDEVEAKSRVMLEARDEAKLAAEQEIGFVRSRGGEEVYDPSKRAGYFIDPTDMPFEGDRDKRGKDPPRVAGRAKGATSSSESDTSTTTTTTTSDTSSSSHRRSAAAGEVASAAPRPTTPPPPTASGVRKSPAAGEGAAPPPSARVVPSTPPASSPESGEIVAGRRVTRSMTTTPPADTRAKTPHERRGGPVVAPPVAPPPVAAEQAQRRSTRSMTTTPPDDARTIPPPAPVERAPPPVAAEQPQRRSTRLATTAAGSAKAPAAGRGKNTNPVSSIGRRFGNLQSGKKAQQLEERARPPAALPPWREIGPNGRVRYKPVPSVDGSPFDRPVEGSLARVPGQYEGFTGHQGPPLPDEPWNTDAPPGGLYKPATMPSVDVPFTLSISDKRTVAYMRHTPGTEIDSFYNAINLIGYFRDGMPVDMGELREKLARFKTVLLRSFAESGSTDKRTKLSLETPYVPPTEQVIRLAAEALKRDIVLVQRSELFPKKADFLKYSGSASPSLLPYCILYDGKRYHALLFIDDVEASFARQDAATSTRRATRAHPGTASHVLRQRAYALERFADTVSRRPHSAPAVRHAPAQYRFPPAAPPTLRFLSRVCVRTTMKCTRKAKTHGGQCRNDARPGRKTCGVHSRKGHVARGKEVKRKYDDMATGISSAPATVADAVRLSWLTRFPGQTGAPTQEDGKKGK
eukprot:jgi/Mesvir1/14674/Mv05340-RA.1